MRIKAFLFHKISLFTHYLGKIFGEEENNYYLCNQNFINHGNKYIERKEICNNAEGNDPGIGQTRIHFRHGYGTGPEGRKVRKVCARRRKQVLIPYYY